MVSVFFDGETSGLWLVEADDKLSMVWWRINDVTQSYLDMTHVVAGASGAQWHDKLVDATGGDGNTLRGQTLWWRGRDELFIMWAHFIIHHGEVGLLAAHHHGITSTSEMVMDRRPKSSLTADLRHGNGRRMRMKRRRMREGFVRLILGLGTHVVLHILYRQWFCCLC